MLSIFNDKIFIGNNHDYYSVLNDNNWKYVHATQTVHYKIMGWNRTNNKPPRQHPNYIIFENDSRISLN